MLKLYSLKFLSKSTPVRAYTLFGALCWAYRLMGGDIEKLLKGFKEGNPPFLISSPFPIAGSESGHSLVFPKPILPVSEEFERNDEICTKINRKPLKKARYVSFGVFMDIVEGRIREEKALAEGFEETNGVVVHKSDKALFEDFKGLSVRGLIKILKILLRNALNLLKI